ncbi:hypothetical protein M422DRAFT_254783 [Sphaerobolus stellatus SS14]|uniref:MYND-type domain-containing protein n=1 Tax=Sphaerobolus stellatus (strain SS14) TaxID=990650 RepID=A0A0C9UGA9_SPHS4|nr:hypothetical protein M422DRAFT_254783 [Sphaerobolus stellatus SS14]
MKVGREIRYCNRECQKADWSMHKITCGKHLGAPDLFVPINIPFKDLKKMPRADIPLSQPGYRRSAHLLDQISRLSESPLNDFIVNGTPPPPPYKPKDILVAYKDLKAASIFICLRNRIMCGIEGGIEASLFFVYQSLQLETSIYPKTLQRQFTGEYGKIWERTWEAYQREEPYTTPRAIARAEIDQALQWLKEAGRFKNELQDFVPGQGEYHTYPFTIGQDLKLKVHVEWPRKLTGSSTGKPRLLQTELKIDLARRRLAAQGIHLNMPAGSGLVVGSRFQAELDVPEELQRNERVRPEDIISVD